MTQKVPEKAVGVRVLMNGSRRGVPDMHIYRMYIYMTVYVLI